MAAKLGSGQWKERKEAMDEIEAILISAGGRVMPQVGGLRRAQGGPRRVLGGLGSQGEGVLGSLIEGSYDEGPSGLDSSVLILTHFVSPAAWRAPPRPQASDV